MAPTTRSSFKNGNDSAATSGLQYPNGLPSPATSTRRPRKPRPHTTSPATIDSGTVNTGGTEPLTSIPWTPTPTPTLTSTVTDHNLSRPAERFITPCPHTINPIDSSAESIDSGPQPSIYTPIHTPPTPTVSKPFRPAEQLLTPVSSTSWYSNPTCIILGIVAILGWSLALLAFYHELCVTVPRMAGLSRGRAAASSCWL